MFQVRIFDEVIEVVEGPPAGSGGGIGSELVVSIAILFNSWTRLMSRLDSKLSELATASLRPDWHLTNRVRSTSSIRRRRTASGRLFFHKRIVAEAPADPTSVAFSRGELRFHIVLVRPAGNHVRQIIIAPTSDAFDVQHGAAIGADVPGDLQPGGLPFRPMLALKKAILHVCRKLEDVSQRNHPGRIFVLGSVE